MIINGLKWKVLVVPPNDSVLRRNNGEYTLGMTDCDKCIVYLSNRLKSPKIERVFAHELTHVFAYSYGVQLDEETEELIADFISLYGVGIVSELNNFIQNLK